MGTYYGSGNAISIAVTGKTLTTGAGSASQALSAVLTLNGVKAKLVSVCCTAAAHISFTVGAGTATADDYLITTTPVLFNVSGMTHINHIQEGAAAKVTITPVEA
jgi:hypothetical protein